MLKQALSFVLLISSFSMAQVSKTQVRPTKVDSPYYASEGIRVGIFKPNYEYKAKSKSKSSLGSGSSSGSLDLDNSSGGLSLGYASLPIRNIGYLASVNYIELVFLDRSTNTLRFDGSAAYAFNKNIYSKAGLNFTQYVGKRNSIDVNGDIGFQIGLGAQITSNVGVDLTYAQSKFNTKYSDEDFSNKSKISIEGLEMGISATF